MKHLQPRAQPGAPFAHPYKLLTEAAAGARSDYPTWYDTVSRQATRYISTTHRHSLLRSGMLPMPYLYSVS